MKHATKPGAILWARNRKWVLYNNGETWVAMKNGIVCILRKHQFNWYWVLMERE